MTEQNSMMARFAPGDVAAAIGLLTRIPIRVDHEKTIQRGAKAVWAYPIAGLVVGGLGGAVGAVALSANMPVMIAAGLVLAVMIILTGAMHEDGLADCADGFWGGWEPVRRLEIMKDSRIGAYGVIALVLGLLLRWAGLVALLDSGWVWAAPLVAAVSSRAAMTAVMVALPHARPDGLSAHVGRPDTIAASVACVIAMLVVLTIWPGALVPVVAAGGVAALGCAAIARTKIGGQTGDVLGAVQQISEIAILGLLASL